MSTYKQIDYLIQEFLGKKIMKNEYRIQDNKCYIKLTQNKETIIDVDDIEFNTQHAH